MNDIKDIKLPIDLPDFGWLWILGAVVLLAVGVYLFLKNRKPSCAINTPIKPLISWEVAYGQLEALRQRDLLTKGLFKEFFTRVSTIVRQYMESRFNIRAPHMSTEEFLNYLKTSGFLNDSQKISLKEFLNSCDMVKFAKYTPTVDEAWKNFELAKRLVDDTRI